MRASGGGRVARERVRTGHERRERDRERERRRASERARAAERWVTG